MPIANIILSGEKCQVFLLRSGAWQGCQLWPLLFSIVLAVPARTIMHKKKKGIRIGKEAVRLFLFAEDTILYGENPKDIPFSAQSVRTKK